LLFVLLLLVLVFFGNLHLQLFNFYGLIWLWTLLHLLLLLPKLQKRNYLRDHHTERRNILSIKKWSSILCSWLSSKPLYCSPLFLLDSNSSQKVLKEDSMDVTKMETLLWKMENIQEAQNLVLPAYKLKNIQLKNTQTGHMNMLWMVWSEILMDLQCMSHFLPSLHQDILLLFSTFSYSYKFSTCWLQEKSMMNFGSSRMLPQTQCSCPFGLLFAFSTSLSSNSVQLLWTSTELDWLDNNGSGVLSLDLLLYQLTSLPNLFLTELHSKWVMKDQRMLKLPKLITKN